MRTENIGPDPHEQPGNLGRRHGQLRDSASLTVSAGVNAKAVQRMLGNPSAVMTSDVYAGLFVDDLEPWPGAWTPGECGSRCAPTPR